MSVEGQLDQAFTTLLAKARQRAEEQAGITPRTASIIFEWAGGGLPLVAANTDPVLIEVPFDSTIVWAHMYAGDAAGLPVAVTATVAVAFTLLSTFGAQSALNGTGLQPSLQADSIRDVDLTSWHTNLLTGDTIIARLASFAGAATWVALSLQLRATQVQIGVAPYVDTGGDTYVDASGSSYVFRS